MIRKINGSYVDCPKNLSQERCEYYVDYIMWNSEIDKMPTMFRLKHCKHGMEIQYDYAPIPIEVGLHKLSMLFKSIFTRNKNVEITKIGGE